MMPVLMPVLKSIEINQILAKILLSAQNNNNLFEVYARWDF